VVNSS